MTEDRLIYFGSMFVVGAVGGTLAALFLWMLRRNFFQDEYDDLIQEEDPKAENHQPEEQQP